MEPKGLTQTPSTENLIPTGVQRDNLYSSRSRERELSVGTPIGIRPKSPETVIKKSSSDNSADGSDKPQANPQGEQISLADIFKQMMEMRGEIKEVKEENRVIKEENRVIKEELRELRVENQQLRQTIADKDRQLLDSEQQKEQFQKQAEESKENELLGIAQANFERADKYLGEAQRSLPEVLRIREDLKKAEDLATQNLKKAQAITLSTGFIDAYKHVIEIFHDFMRNGPIAGNDSNSGEGSSTDGRPMSVRDDRRAFASSLAIRLSTYCVNKLSPEKKNALSQEQLISHFQTAITSNQVYNTYCTPVEDGLKQVEDQIAWIAEIHQTCVKLHDVAKDVLAYTSKRGPQIDEQLKTIDPDSALATILQKEKQKLTEANPLYQQAEKDWNNLQENNEKKALDQWKKCRVQWRMTRGEAIPEDDSDYYSDLDQPETVKGQIERELRDLKLLYMQENKNWIDKFTNLRKNTSKDQLPKLAEDEKKEKGDLKQKYEQAETAIHTRYEQRLDKSIHRSIEKTESQLLAAAHSVQGTNLKKIVVHFQNKPYDLPLVEEQPGGDDCYWDPKRGGVRLLLLANLIWSKHPVLLEKREDGQYTLPPPDKQRSPFDLAQKGWESLDDWRIRTALAETTPPSSHEVADMGTIRYILNRLERQEEKDKFKRVIAKLKERKAEGKGNLHLLEHILSSRDDLDYLLGQNSPDFNHGMYGDGTPCPRGMDISELFHTYQFAYVGVGKDGHCVDPIPVDNVANYHEHVDDKDWYVVGLLRKEPGSAQQTSSGDKSLPKRISSGSGESVYQSIPGGKSFYSVSEGSTPIPPPSPSEEGFNIHSEDDASSEPSVPSTNSSMFSLNRLTSLYESKFPGIEDLMRKIRYSWQRPTLDNAEFQQNYEKLCLRYDEECKKSIESYREQLNAHEHERKKALAALDQKYKKKPSASQPSGDAHDPGQTEGDTDEAYQKEKEEKENHWKQKKSDLAKENGKREEALTTRFDKNLQRLYKRYPTSVNLG